MKNTHTHFVCDKCKEEIITDYPCTYGAEISVSERELVPHGFRSEPVFKVELCQKCEKEMIVLLKSLIKEEK